MTATKGTGVACPPTAAIAAVRGFLYYIEGVCGISALAAVYASKGGII